MSVTEMLITGHLSEETLPDGQRPAAAFFLSLTRVGLSLLLVSLIGAALLNATGLSAALVALGVLAGFTALGVRAAQRVLPLERIRALIRSAASRAPSYTWRLGILGVAAAATAVMTRDAAILIGMAGAVTATGAAHLALALTTRSGQA